MQGPDNQHIVVVELKDICAMLHLWLGTINDRLVNNTTANFVTLNGL